MPFIGNRVIHANFNLKGLQDPESQYYNIDNEKYNVLNNLSETITLWLDKTHSPYSLSITTNGIDGIGFRDETFKLNSIYFQNQKIFFTVRVKTFFENPAKYMPKLTFGTGNNQISLTATSNGEYIDTYFYDNVSIIDEKAGGYYKGYIILDKPYDNVKIYGEVKSDFAKSSTNYINGAVSGVSTPFNVHPTIGKNVYRKINEDNDQKENYKKLIFQNILLDKNSFFDNFLGTIVGDISGNPNNLGTKIYEKISNMPANISDYNYSNTRSLISLLDSTDIDIEKYNINIPPSLQRIIDNLSIPLTLQKGFINNYNQNFNDKGYENSNIFGLNKGVELDFNTTVLKTGPESKPIIAYEKFSENYTLLDTNLLSTYDFRYNGDNTNTYSLSDYDKNWGWGLVVPDNLFEKTFISFENNTVSKNGNNLKDKFLTLQNNVHRLLDENFDNIKGDINNVKNFYRFFEFNDKISGEYGQQFIDYSNPATKIQPLTSFDQFSNDGGFIDDLILQSMYTGLSLISS